MTFRFERFEAWRRAIEFANLVMQLADGLPPNYQRSLGDQRRRAALSIPTNLAEGSGREGPREERYLYSVAKGSVLEVVSLLVIATRRGHLHPDQYQAHYALADELAAMISGAIKSTYERE